MGGMTEAVAAGMPKLRIEESAARRQAAIDRGEEVVVGVNRYQPEHDEPVEILDIDNTTVRARQIERLAKVRDERDDSPVPDGSCRANHLRRDWRGKSPRLVDRGDARPRYRRRSLRRIVRKYSPAIAPRRSACPASMARRTTMTAASTGCAAKSRRSPIRRPAAAAHAGGQARARTATTRGSKVIATAFADLGFDVDIGPLFQLPEEAARQAIENDVHVVGVSSQAAGHKILVPEMVASLRALGAGEVIVICGGVIPPKDHDFLRQAGVAAIYGAGDQHPRCRRRDPRPHRSASPGGVSTPDTDARVAAIRGGDRRALAQAITLIESTRSDHRADAEVLLDGLLPHAGKAIRIGISGAPGSANRRSSRPLVCT